ncbi:MAG TPA: CHRD domain-containing protein, partial [Bacteroidota bacterium]
MNLHTGNHPAGEISGLFKYYDGTFTTMLNGAQAGTSSTGTGTAWLHFGRQNDTASYRVTFAGLAGAYSGSHFHLAPGGGVIHPIAVTDSTGSGIWFVPDSIISAILKGNVYVNIHSATFPAGDIRGTLGASLGTATSVRQVSQNVPSQFSLEQNYPNPFNPSTSIGFSLTHPARVTLKVFNVLGQEVATLMDGQQNSGSYKVTFDARMFASGVYLYRLTTSDGGNVTKKMVLLK